MSAATNPVPYTIVATTDDGTIHEIEGLSLYHLAAALESIGYAGPAVRVVNEGGWTVGWVRAGHWTATGRASTEAGRATTIDTVTTSQIEALRAEAAEAGDEEQVRICDAALAGDGAAVIECVAVIHAAEVAS